MIESGYFLPHLAGKRDGFIHRHVFNRDERHYIDCSHTGVLSLVIIEIYQFHRNTDSFDNGIPQGFRFTDKSHHQPVMIFIIAIIEQLYSCTGTKRSNNTIYFFKITPFTEVGNAFHDFIPIHNYTVLGSPQITRINTDISI